MQFSERLIAWRRAISWPRTDQRLSEGRTLSRRLGVCQPGENPQREQVPGNRDQSRAGNPLCLSNIRRRRRSSRNKYNSGIRESYPAEHWCNTMH
jgi:hypothetical protein